MKNKKDFRKEIGEIIYAVDKVVFGVMPVTKLILIAIICDDHVLVEDVPGTGKTMLVNTVANILDLDFKRVQGTPDLLPGDLTGINIFDQNTHKFKFTKGPVFTNMLLFDEINRASPKTQSALLEAMAEKQVSTESDTYKLDSPFFVVATQNPIEHVGTYPPPQAQMDRFLFRTDLGFPEPRLEMKIMLTEEEEIEKIELPNLNKKKIFSWRKEYKKIFVKEELVKKLLNVIQKTRDKNIFSLGISPRSSRKLIKALKASAYIHGRDFVSKDDIFDLFIPTMAHRVSSTTRGEEKLVLKRLIMEADF